jgi:hypothetical protein
MMFLIFLKGYVIICLKETSTLRLMEFPKLLSGNILNNYIIMLDTMDDTKLCTKLTDAHIKKKKMNKMKVSHMTQVFSHQVGSLMKRISQWSK